MNKHVFLIILLVLSTVSIQAEVVSVDISQGRSFSKNVIGISRTFDGALELANSGNIVLRGPAGGLRANMYDWQKNTGNIPYNEPITLDLLIESRDTAADLLFTANMVGTGPLVRSHSAFVWTNNDINMLVELASEWVTYTNVIVPNYRQGDSLPASYQDILDDITWSPKLLPPGAAATPKVDYWEIGNEVPYSEYANIDWTPSVFVSRYKSIANAMLAVDNTIKVGPAIVLVSPTDDELVRYLLQDQTAPVDFVAIHPYQYPNLGMLWGEPNDVVLLEQGLRDTSGFLREKFWNLYNTVVQDRGQAAAESMEYMITEWNSTGYNYFGEQRSMANALSGAESIFTFADLGVRMGSFWPLTRDDDHGMYPIGKVFVAMAEYMGDTLVKVYPDVSQHDSSNHRLYVTKDSSTGMVSVWGLNFDNDEDWTVNVNLNNVAPGKNATLMQLKGLQQDAGLKTLDSPGVSEINWDVQNMAALDYSNFDLTVPAAGLSVIVVDDSTIAYKTPAILADPNGFDPPVYEDNFDNEWTAYEVTAQNSGKFDSYVPMSYSSAAKTWKGTGAEYTGILQTANVNNSDILKSYVDSNAAYIGAISFKPTLGARFNFGGTVIFMDETGTSGSEITIRKFDSDGDSQLIKVINAVDNEVVDMSAVSELQAFELEFGEALMFEVSGTAVGHTYSADLSNMLIRDVSCMKIEADFNDDCKVDLYDFAILADNWLFN